MQRTGTRATARFEQKRERILDAATELLNRHGVKGLTLGEAAAAVGLSTTSVTYYFKRKDELAAACMMRGIEALQAIVENALRKPAPEQRLRRLLELYVGRVRQAVLKEAPPLPSLADMRALNPPVLGQVFHAYMKLFRTLRQIFEGPGLEWLTRGRRTARTHMLLEQLSWAAVWLTAFDPEDYDRVLERMLDILVGGFAKPGATWSPVALPLADFAPHDGPEPGRETFLLAATRLINARGYRGASVDKISAELNVTKGSFYHHIDAKDDLVLACFERSFEVMRRAHRHSQNLQGDTWRKLSSLAAGLTEFQLTREGPLLRASALAALPPALQTKIFLDADRIAQRFRATISDGIADGSLRPVDPAIAAMMLSAMLNAGAELAFWVPGIKAKAAPAVFARPLLMGVFER